ncbi:hypothetical protein [Deinococcus koreensis]|uniref:DUF1440 domain-containing protein n=1 Tax=Deinococcus koreensis TaxID=2054903 RepID=A0A2K3UVF0_9DEIO|nr:hypothetical protein [Deinococcus koreensis]PNY80507.1 hypothetical protein CVO96_03220 [Deinococcus koreensis]
MTSALQLARALLRRDPPASPAYRGALIGLAAGAAGTLIMGQYWVRVAPLLSGPAQEQPESGEGQDAGPQGDQDIISPLGQTHENGESSTAALGRHLYTALTHRVPEPGTRAALSEGVHWAMGVFGGAAYGALLARRPGPPSGLAVSGLLWGAALWLVMDETVTPLLGLQDGPRAGDARTHGNRLGAHLGYGLGLGLSAAALNRVLPR